MNNQNPAQNIERDIDTMTYIVYGKMRNGKTLLAILMGLDWEKRIYSNVNIYRNGKSIVNFVESYEDLKKIRFSYMPGVLIMDESGINNNSKDTFSKDNRFLQELLFLIGKKNLSLIWIAQRFESIDVNARALVDGIFEMRKIKRQNNHPIFVCTRKKQKGANLIDVQKTEIDTITALKIAGLSYNQLEESKMKKTGS